MIFLILILMYLFVGSLVCISIYRELDKKRLSNTYWVIIITFFICTLFLWPEHLYYELKARINNV